METKEGSEFGRFILIGRVTHDTQNLRSYYAGIPMNNLGVLRGWTASEVMEARGRTIFHWSDHFKRLEISAKDALIDLSKIEVIASGDLKKRLGDLLENNGFEESIIHLHCTAGTTLDGWTPSANPELYACVFKQIRKKGAVHLHTRQFRRHLAHIKRPDYFFGARERFAVSKAHADDGKIHDILYVNQVRNWRLEILETTGSNICFIYKGGHVQISAFFDDDDNAQRLNGVTQEIVIDLIEKSKDLVVFYPLSYDPSHSHLYFGDLTNTIKKDLDGALLMSTTGVVPVEKIDDLILPIGPLTRKLQKMFYDYREHYFSQRPKKLKNK